VGVKQFQNSTNAVYSYCRNTNSYPHFNGVKTQQSFTNVYKRQQMFIKAIATNRLNIFVELTAVRTALFTNYKTEPL
jgi:hypothetical protein